MSFFSHVWKSSSRMHIGETVTHQITFCNNCRLFGGALLWMKFRHDKWMDCLQSDMKTWIRGTKYIDSSGRSLCLPTPDPCLAHTHFSHLFWNIVDLIKNNDNKYTYISDSWSGCNIRFRLSLKPRDRPRFPITWSDRDIPSSDHMPHTAASSKDDAQENSQTVCRRQAD